LAKTLFLYLPQEITIDFQAYFSNKEDERVYLYQHATKIINEGVGDVFVKKTLNLRLIKNNKPTIVPSTFDDINFDGIELVSNPEWRAKDVAGKLVSFEYVVGASFWDKINNWAKLSSVLNQKFNDSVLENNQKLLSELSSDGVTDPILIKQKKVEITQSNKRINDFKNEECIESYIHSLFAGIIISKIKAEQQSKLDKEFEELNKPKTN